MAIFKLLHDLYRFPGFVPLAQVRGLFGDPHAVVITLRAPPKKTACGVCGQEYYSHYDKRTRRVRDLSCGDKRVYLTFRLRRVQCSRCGGVKNEGLDWLADNPLYTKRFAFFVGRLSPDAHQGGGRGTLPRLARRQGVGQAVHGQSFAGSAPQPPGLLASMKSPSPGGTSTASSSATWSVVVPSGLAAWTVPRPAWTSSLPGWAQKNAAKSAWRSWTCGRRSVTPPSRRETLPRPRSCTTSSTS